MTIKTNPILMLTLNCLNLTKQAIKTCQEQDIPTSLYVADDGSTDGTLEWLRNQNIYVSSKRHFGVTRWWNTALTYLFDFSDQVLVVNNDIRLRSDTISLLLQDGGEFVTCVGTSSGALFPGDTPKLTRRPHPDFSCFLIRKSCWNKIGQFDESMRIYSSDGDYHLRMHKAGIDAHCVDVPFWHEASGTLKHVDEVERVRIVAQAQRDKEAFEKKWGFTMGSKEYYEQFKTLVKE